jgi:transcriptional regulator with XRE-family HTH domain
MKNIGKRSTGMNYNEVFAKRIRELRNEKGLGVRQLAAELNIGNSSLSQYENCKRVPDIITARMFADYFGVTTDYLIGLTDEKYK